MDFKHICRLCLLERTSGLHEIDEHVQELFQDLTQYKLSCFLDILEVPNSVCDICLGSLIKCTDVKRTFIEKQKELERNFSAGHKIDIKDELDMLHDETQSTKDLEDYQIVLEIESTSDFVECPTCFKLFSHDEIFQHVQTHDTHGNLLEKPIKRQQCAVCGSFVKNLSDHLKFTHNQAKKKFYCDMCSYASFFKTKITRHLQRHIPKEFRNLLKCQVCDFRCSRKDALKSHMASMHQDRHRNFSCPHCDKLFYNASNVNIHIKSVHQNVRDFTCQHCQKGFFTKKDLKMHVSRHFEKSEKCLECHALFSCSVDLKRHMRHKHSLPTVACDVPNCNRKFHTKSQLKIHIKTGHENLKEFICSYCGIKFGQQNNLKRHVDSVHKALKIYCPVDDCSVSIARKDKFKNHLIKMHKELDEKTRDVILKNVKQE